MKKYLFAAATVAAGLAFAAPLHAQAPGTGVVAPGGSGGGAGSATGGAGGGAAGMGSRGSAPSGAGMSGGGMGGSGAAMTQGGMGQSSMAAPTRKKARKAKKSSRKRSM